MQNELGVQNPKNSLPRLKFVVSRPPIFNRRSTSTLARMTMDELEYRMEASSYPQHGKLRLDCTKLGKKKRLNFREFVEALNPECSHVHICLIDDLFLNNLFHDVFQRQNLKCSRLIAKAGGFASLPQL